jgi:hypothetical protein
VGRDDQGEHCAGGRDIGLHKNTSAGPPPDEQPQRPASKAIPRKYRMRIAVTPGGNAKKVPPNGEVEPPHGADGSPQLAHSVPNRARRTTAHTSRPAPTHS